MSSYDHLPEFKKKLFYLIIGPIALSIVIAGLSWPLGYGGSWLWPWNKGWFMFSYSNPYAQHLVAIGGKQDGSKAEIDLEQWFGYQASPLTKRYDEVEKNPNMVGLIAYFLCKKDPSLATISLYNYWWHTTKGKRVDVSQRIEQQKYVLLENVPCP